MAACGVCMTACRGAACADGRGQHAHARPFGQAWRLTRPNTNMETLSVTMRRLNRMSKGSRFARRASHDDAQHTTWQHQRSTRQSRKVSRNTSARATKTTLAPIFGTRLVRR
jgi:hypothetical protein